MASLFAPEPFRPIGIAYAEFLWWIYRRLENARGWQREERVTKRRAYLRQLIRRTPWWRRGHLLFGMNELHGILLMSDRPSPRSLASLRVSALAVLQDNDPSKRRVLPFGIQRILLAKFLLAMLAFLSREYADALQKFTSLLAYNNIRFLPPHICILALENAGAAALTLGDDNNAYEYFIRIPEDKRSVTVKGALELIDAKREEQGA